jgi:antitoxin MazE
METKVQKWGNSLGVRIPRSVAAEARLSAGSAVQISAQDDAIVIRPVSRLRYSLAELLKGVKRGNLHSQVPTGEPVGKEAL